MRRLALFARPPVPGRVKTRLSPALPEALVAELYQAMLGDTFSAAADAPADERVLYWASDEGGAPDLQAPAGFVVRQQRGADLGARLAAAFTELLAAPEDRAVIIGADCPDLDPAAIRDSISALESHDLVLGPARDGGYYLIGLRVRAPSLFEGVAWGTARVRGVTLARAADAGLRVAELPELADLDTPEDLVSLIARRSLSGAGPGRRVDAALRAMGLLPPPA